MAIENRDNIDEAFCVVIDDILPNVPAIICLSEDVPSQRGGGSEGDSFSTCHSMF